MSRMIRSIRAKCRACRDFLDGVILARVQHALFGKEVVKGLLAHAAIPFLGHHAIFRLHLRAKSSSARGVFRSASVDSLIRGWM
jgi:hypothetical protein